MENFKEIAEKCLAGELSGTFKLASGESVSSDKLERLPNSCKSDIYCYQMWVNGVTAFTYTIYGTLFKYKFHSLDVIDFIPDNMQEQIKIDIPEGKVPVMEQTEKGVVITWKEKELTYDGIINEIAGSPKHIIGFSYGAVSDTTSSSPFYKKVEVLRKLTNIRNYFGGDKSTNSWVITIDSALRPYVINNPRSYRESCFIYFDTKEHAEQAIKMLGDELKYLFEPW